MKHELEEAQCKVDCEEAEWAHKECVKCDTEHRHEEATKETQELEAAKAQVAKYEVEAKASAEVGS